MPVHALKTGMLDNAAIVTAVADALEAHYPDARTMPPLIVDPVCVSTSGHTLLAPDAVDTLKTRLLPLARIVTPNLAEAQLLASGREGVPPVESLLDVLALARAVRSKTGCRAVLLKGGHLPLAFGDVLSAIAEYSPNPEPLKISMVDMIVAQGIEILSAALPENLSSDFQVVVDVLLDGDLEPGRDENKQVPEFNIFISPRINSQNTHGTGCTLSASLACALAHGLPSTWHRAFLCLSEHTCMYRQ
jgi:hydroxymethylpyrimidine/phosphomethylpyrimidine kinase